MAPKQQKYTPVYNTPKNETKDKPKQAEAKAEPKPDPLGPTDTVPLSRRKFDCIFIITYLLWFTAGFISLITKCRTLVPDQLGEIQLKEPVCDAVAHLEHALHPVLETQEKWNQKVASIPHDFTFDLTQRSVLFTAPVALFLALGFKAGSQWVKNVGLVHATLLFSSMIVLDTFAFKALHQLETEAQTLHSLAFIGRIVYGFFTLFPLLVLRRLWADFPFQKKTLIDDPRKLSFVSRFVLLVIRLIAYLWLIAVFVSYYEFAVKHTSSFEGLPSVVESSQQAWEQTSQHREQLLVQTEVVKEVVAEYGAATAKALGDALESVGQAALEVANQLNQGGESQK